MAAQPNFDDLVKHINSNGAYQANGVGGFQLNETDSSVEQNPLSKLDGNTLITLKEIDSLNAGAQATLQTLKEKTNHIYNLPVSPRHILPVILDEEKQDKEWRRVM